MLNDDLSVIKAGFADLAQNSHSVAIATGAAQLDYNAQYITEQGSATAGPAVSRVQYTIAYQ
ncbi:hypothetical protein D9M69_724070 [compost metagenome]